MTKPNRKRTGKLLTNGLMRNFSASVAGARAGSAIAADSALNRLIPKRNSNRLAEREAKRLVDQLGKLKGTYVKIGQMMALLGEHFLPDELAAALHSLHDATEPLPWETVNEAFQQQLGSHYSELEIDPVPLAAASLAQVHRARVIATNREVCLKLLYPGVTDTIESDFKTVKRMLSLTRVFKAARDLDRFIDDIKELLLFEINYRREADMIELIGSQLKDDSRYKVPTIYRRYCTDNLLCMEYLEGYAVNHSTVSQLPLYQRNEISMAMLDLFFKEIYNWGIIQSDPNFGNYRIIVDEGKVTLGLLDFGSMIETPPGFTKSWSRTITGVRQNDRPSLISGLIGMGFLDKDSSKAAQDSFADFCYQIMEPLIEPQMIPKARLNERGQYRWSKSNLVHRVGKQAAKSTAHQDFALPSQQFAYVARKLTGVFTFISALNAEFNGSEVLDQYIDQPPNS